MTTFPTPTPPLGALLARVDAAMVDLDGTLVDTLGDFDQALNRTLADLGLPTVPVQEIERRVGKGTEHLLRSVLKYVLTPVGSAQCAIDTGAEATAAAEPAVAAERLYPAAWERYHHHYHALNGQYARIYPGVVAGLDALRARGLRLACLTNKPTALAVPLLRAKGLAGYFEHVFGGDAFARKKPDPLPLLATCAALGTPAARTLMLGDSRNDAQAARAAGCPVLLVTYGYNHGQPARAVDADAWVDTLDELRC